MNEKHPVSLRQLVTWDIGSGHPFLLKNCPNGKPLVWPATILKKTTTDNSALDCQKSLLATTTNWGVYVWGEESKQMNKKPKQIK